MDNKFIKIGLIIPLVSALTAGLIIFFVINANTKNISPFLNGSTAMYFDDTEPGSKTASANELGSLKRNELLGNITGSKTLPLRYKCDYSNLANCASLSDKGSQNIGYGTAYVQIISGNSSFLADDLSLTGVFGSKKYQKVKQKTVKNENEVFSVTGKEKSMLVIYYRQAAGGGLSSKFTVITYEEAA